MSSIAFLSPWRRAVAATLVAALLLLLTCSMPLAGEQVPPFDAAKDVPPAPVYSQRASWLALPEGAPQGPMDVFWVYPTVLGPGGDWLMDIHDPELQAAARRTLTQQAMALAEGAAVYAPLYRQMSMAGLALDDEGRAAIMRYGMEDVWAALEQYLEHYNKGRPFVLAGHSQGANLLAELLVKHWGQTGAEERLVAGYLIGWSITGGDLDSNKAMRMCEEAAQTGCFVSYNSVGQGRQDVAPTIRPNAVVVNPLSWRIDSELAPASLNLGAVFFDEAGGMSVHPGFTSAQVVDGGVVVAPADASLVAVRGETFPAGVYHQYDYALFFMNLRQNVGERLEAWLGRN